MSRQELADLVDLAVKEIGYYPEFLDVCFVVHPVDVPDSPTVCALFASSVRQDYALALSLPMKEVAGARTLMALVTYVKDKMFECAEKIYPLPVRRELSPILEVFITSLGRQHFYQTFQRKACHED